MKIKNLFKKKSNERETYFVADIAANHDGDLSKAKELIYAAAESGANSAKFQNFKAETIVSDLGFKYLGKKYSHQSKWEKTVFETYKSAELPIEWTLELIDTCNKCKIEYFTAPYDLTFSKLIAEHTKIVKMGSGEITWHEHLELVSNLFDIILIATGASEIKEVEDSMRIFENNNVILMQCNTDYTAKITDSRDFLEKRYNCINLKVLDTYEKLFPKTILGLSDHTHGNTTVLGAVGLFNAKVIEKHFTLSNNKKGPDHPFSMTPNTWRDMVKKTRYLEKQIKNIKEYSEKMKLTLNLVDDKVGLKLAIGDGEKRVEHNEKDTVVLQRRCFYLKNNIKKDTKIFKSDLIPLRPCLKNSFKPYESDKIIGKKACSDLQKGSCVFRDQVY